MATTDLASLATAAATAAAPLEGDCLDELSQLAPVNWQNYDYSARHVLRAIKPDAKGFDRTAAIDQCCQFLIRLSGKSCVRINNQRQTSCTCLGILHPPSNIGADNIIHQNRLGRLKLVASSMIHFVGLHRKERMERMAEWMREADAFRIKLDRAEKDCKVRRQRFLIPVKNCEGGTGSCPTVGEGGADEEFGKSRICRDALCAIFDIGRTKWKTVADNLDDVMPEHKLRGRPGNVMKGRSGVYVSMSHFLGEMMLRGERLVPDGAQDSGKKSEVIVELPSTLSKHKLYEQWCFSRGKVPYKLDASKSRYARPDDFPDREHDDYAAIPMWPSGSKPQPLVTWSAFLSYWNKNFPNLRIKKKTIDVTKREGEDATVARPQKRLRRVGPNQTTQNDASSDESAAGQFLCTSIHHTQSTAY